MPGVLSLRGADFPWSALGKNKRSISFRGESSGHLLVQSSIDASNGGDIFVDLGKVRMMPALAFE